MAMKWQAEEEEAKNLFEPEADVWDMQQYSTCPSFGVEMGGEPNNGRQGGRKGKWARERGKKPGVRRAERRGKEEREATEQEEGRVKHTKHARAKNTPRTIVSQEVPPDRQPCSYNAVELYRRSSRQSTSQSTEMLQLLAHAFLGQLGNPAEA